MEFSQSYKELYPSFSIVIEWENIRHAEQWRVRAMLQQLCKQLMEISTKLSRVEVIFVYNSEEVKEGQIKELVEDYLLECRSMVNIMIVPTPRLGYYELKNFGAERSSGDIIIYLDSDVIPEEKWLANILQAFNQPDVLIVAGNSYIVPVNVVSKAYALLWFFPPRSEDGPISAKKFLFANNVGFKRELLSKFQFPTLPLFRGQCAELADDLWNSGHKIFFQPLARVSHPPPHGTKFYFIRALCHGHDMIMRMRIRREKKLASLSTTTKVRSLNQTIARLHLLEHYKHANIRPEEIIIILAIDIAYLAIVSVGLLITCIKPDLLRKYLSI